MIGEMDYEFDIWYKTKDPIFSSISKKSRLPEKWITFSFINKSKYKDSIIKPINNYVETLVPPPVLISIDNKTVTLRQGNHAEFFLLKNGMFFKNIDRPWMRQYYNTDEKFTIPDNCFRDIFKFYVPWYIDANVKVKYIQSEDSSPFFIYGSESQHSVVDLQQQYLEPDFVPFSFKKEGKHMIDNNYGKIKRQSAMFDIVFECDDIMLERVRKFYEEE